MATRKTSTMMKKWRSQLGCERIRILRRGVQHMLLAPRLYTGALHRMGGGGNMSTSSRVHVNEEEWRK